MKSLWLASLVLMSSIIGAQEHDYQNTQDIVIPNWDLTEGLYEAPPPISIGSFRVADGIDSLIDSIGTDPNQVRPDLRSWHSDEQMGRGAVPLVFAFIGNDGLLTELRMELKQMPGQSQWQPQFANGLGLGDPEAAFLEAGLVAAGEYVLEDDPRDPGRLKIYSARYYALVFSDTRIGTEDDLWRLIEIRLELYE